MRVSKREPGPVARLPATLDRAVPADAETLRRERERTIDEELAQSFPASDPPSWTMGVAPAAIRSDDDSAGAVPAVKRDRRALH